jgi:hypothetical protein
VSGAAPIVNPLPGGTGNATIQGNHVSIPAGACGIQVMNMDNPELLDNVVTREVLSSVLGSSSQLIFHPKWVGILSQGNYGARIQDNKVLLSGPGVNQGADLRITNSPETELWCNLLHGEAYFGIDINGPCDNSSIEGNDIGSHGIGLNLGGSAVIGQQPATGNYTPGNKWTGSYWTLAAQNLNTNSLPAILGNRILANGSMGVYPLYPDNYPDNLPVPLFSGVTWFAQDPSPPVLCIPNSPFPVPLNPQPFGNTFSLNEAIALGLITASDYNNETRWILNKTLLGKQSLMDSLVFINDTLLQFFTDPGLGNLKELNQLEDTLKPMLEKKEMYKLALHQHDSVMQQLRMAMSQQAVLLSDSVMSPSALSQYQSFKSQYVQEMEAKKVLQEELLEDTRLLALAGLEANNNFVPQNYNEALSKMVNEVYYRYYVHGDDSLRPGDISTLESIIHICPLAGGPAVYRARAMYQLVSDTIEYQDSLICAQSNYFREAKEAWEAQSEQVIMEQENAILMFPNPAQTQLNIWFKEELMGEIRITDALGRQVWFERYGTASRSRVIDLSQLSSGLYILHYRDASKQWTGKFIKNE